MTHPTIHTRKPKSDADVLRWIEESPVKLDERIRHLSAAIEHIRVIRSALNTRKGTCEACGVTLYEDFTDAQGADRLDGWIEKMERELGRYVSLKQRTVGGS